MELCGSVPGSVVLRERNKDTKGPGSNLREKLRLTKNSRYTQNTRDKMNRSYTCIILKRKLQVIKNLSNKLIAVWTKV